MNASYLINTPLSWQVCTLKTPLPNKPPPPSLTNAPFPYLRPLLYLYHRESLGVENCRTCSDIADGTKH